MEEGLQDEGEGRLDPQEEGLQGEEEVQGVLHLVVVLDWVFLVVVDLLVLVEVALLALVVVLQDLQLVVPLVLVEVLQALDEEHQHLVVWHEEVDLQVWVQGLLV